jgi:streptogramin lyase
VAGPDGNLWFTELEKSRIGRMTPRGVVTRFSAGIGAGANPMGITAGPDGNLWFTEYGKGRIGRITPAGVVTEFSAGITGGIPGPIAGGPGGDVWFAESAANGTTNRIGRITPSGQVTEYPLGGAARSGITDVAAGPDGNLWFTLYGDRVGRITPAGAVRFFSAGISRGSLPGAITAGPDGNLWFTEPATTGRKPYIPVAGNRVARITPAGVVTEFSAGISAASAPGGIAAGADGNLWFTEPDGTRIARITPSGVASEFPPTAAILGIRLRGTRSVVVRLRCPSGAARHCRGTLTETLGSPAPQDLPALVRRIDIAPGRTAQATYPLRPAGRRQLAVHGKVGIALVLLPSPPGTAGMVQAGAALRQPDPIAVLG